MSLIPLQKENFDSINLKAFGSKNYTSGSSLCFNTPVGESGCVPAVYTRSKSIKDVDNIADDVALSYQLNNLLNNNRHAGKEYLQLKNSQSFGNLLNSPTSNYLFKVKRNSIKYEVPEPSLDDNINKSTSYTKRSFIKNNLYPYYKNISSKIDNYNYGFTNYNSLNFFTLGINEGYSADSDKTHKTCLIYHNYANRYTPDGIKDNFTFECWINPKRSNISDFDYNYGTIVHIPYLCAIYLAQGSSIDEYGHVDKFRIQVQLGSEANSLPDRNLLSNSDATISSSKAISKDNCLNKNNWHHLAVVYERTRLKIYIDGIEVLGNSVANDIADISTDPVNSVITIGNRFAGTSDTYWDTDKSELIDYFFGTDIYSDYALEASTGTRAASSFDINTAFDNDLDATNSTSLALNAEISDIRLYNSVRLKSQINIDKVSYVDSLKTADNQSLVFYLPLYYVPQKITRKGFKSAGEKKTITYSSPVNPFFSHQILGHEVSVEHFTREFVKGPRPYINGIHDQSYLGETALDAVYTEDVSFNEKLCNLFLTDDTTTADRREDNLLLRNYLILPCDNGLTYPKWELIEELFPDSKNFVFNKDIFGNALLGQISVHSLIDFVKDDINTGSGLYIYQEIKNSLYRQDRVIDDLDVDKESHSRVQLRLNGLSSNNNQLANIANTKPLTTESSQNYMPFYVLTSDLGELYSCFFDIPNPFYGSIIKEESLSIEDLDLYGTAGVLSIKLQDNEEGHIYRSDSLTKIATWNSIGHMFNREGIVTVLHPGLSTFGAISYDIKFKSTQGVNVFEINVPCPEGSLNVSTNKGYKSIKPTDYKSDSSAQFVFIDNINLHDENLNIVAKAQLSKPLAKRIDDKYNFRLKLDY